MFGGTMVKCRLRTTTHFKLYVFRGTAGSERRCHHVSLQRVFREGLCQSVRTLRQENLQRLQGGTLRHTQEGNIQVSITFPKKNEMKIPPIRIKHRTNGAKTVWKV